MDISMVVPTPKWRTRSEGSGMQGSEPLGSNEALASLLASATVALDTDRHAARSCIQRAAALLGIDLSSGGDGAAGRVCLRGSLAPWQAQRLRSYIEDKLDSTIRAADLAGLVRLSTSHFFRAFHKTFGESPIAYIMKRRIRRAQQLMMTSRLPLSQVAVECGMSDQSHLSRTFRRIVGTNPRAWRRQFPMGPAPNSSPRQVVRDPDNPMGLGTRHKTSVGCFRRCVGAEASLGAARHLNVHQSSVSKGIAQL